MKLLIMGGSGQLSRRVAEMARDAGHDVWCLTRGNRPLPEGVYALTGDRSEDASIRRALEGAGMKWDAAIDCICMNARHAMQDVSILPGYTGRVAVVSTDSVYHPAHKRVPMTEEADAYMSDGGYGAKKREMEEVFLANRTAIRWTIFRPGHIFGPGFLLGCFPEQSRQADLLEHMRADRPLRLVGGGKLLIHPIFVDDMAQALLDCLDSPAAEGEIFCIGGPEALPNAAYYEIIGRIIGHPAIIQCVPMEGYLEAHPEYSGHLCQRCYDLGKMQRAGIPLPATPIEEGLRRHVAWLDRQ